MYGILEFRQEQVLQKVTETTLQSVELLRDITTRIQQQNGEVLLAAQQSQRDSVTIKILTYIAVVFLPGSLVAVSDFNVTISDLQTLCADVENICVDHLQLKFDTATTNCKFKWNQEL